MSHHAPSGSCPRPPGQGRPVEDYTNAFLVSFGVLVFCLLVTFWVVAGPGPTLIAAWLADRAIARLSRRSRPPVPPRPDCPPQ